MIFGFVAVISNKSPHICKIVYFSLAFIALCLIQFSCKKDPHLNVANVFVECNKKNGFDSLEINDHLTGKWHLTGRFMPNGDKKELKERIDIALFADKSYVVYSDSREIQRGVWILSDKRGSYFLHGSPGSEYIGGTVLFCKNELMLNSSFVDGEDLLYKAD